MHFDLHFKHNILFLILSSIPAFQTKNTSTELHPWVPIQTFIQSFIQKVHSRVNILSSISELNSRVLFQSSNFEFQYRIPFQSSNYYSGMELQSYIQEFLKRVPFQACTSDFFFYSFIPQFAFRFLQQSSSRAFLSSVSIPELYSAFPLVSSFQYSVLEFQCWVPSQNWAGGVHSRFL